MTSGKKKAGSKKPKKKIPPDVLGEWVHSHEEDKPGEMVFRRPGYAFPPSRGRDAFALQANGDLTEEAPGPTDKLDTVDGKWQLSDAGPLELKLESPHGTRTLQIASVAADRMVVKS